MTELERLRRLIAQIELDGGLLDSLYMLIHVDPLYRALYTEVATCMDGLYKTLNDRLASLEKEQINVDIRNSNV